MKHSAIILRYIVSAALIVLASCGGYSEDGTAIGYTDGTDGFNGSTPSGYPEDRPPGEDEAGDTSDASVQDVCSDATDAPVTLFMSADDSNSQASPVYMRALVMEHDQDPALMWNRDPREYEYLNYYTFNFEDRPEWGQLDVVPEARYDEDASNVVFLVSVVSPDLDISDRRPINFVFSLDTSGSMDGGGIERTQYTLRAIAHVLREGDHVSIVTWNSEQNTILEDYAVTGPDDSTFLAAVDSLSANGSTDLHAGLVTAYRLASAHYSADMLTRVFLISDGGANTGVTDASVIGSYAEAVEGEGIYMIGIGAASDDRYYDHRLMDTVTDLGKGAYVYVDSQEEADRMFGPERFLSNVEVAALNVRLEVDVPPMFVLDEFHGEEVSTDASRVREQNIAPNDGMFYHFSMRWCSDATSLPSDSQFTFRVTWQDIATRQEHFREVTMTLAELFSSDITRLHKADLLVRYARILVNADGLDHSARIEEIGTLMADIQAYVRATGDSEMNEPVEVLDHLSGIVARE